MTAAFVFAQLVCVGFVQKPVVLYVFLHLQRKRDSSKEMSGKETELKLDPFKRRPVGIPQSQGWAALRRSEPPDHKQTYYLGEFLDPKLTVDLASLMTLGLSTLKK